MKMKEITVKLIALALCGCITCSFAACGDSADSGTTDSKKAVQFQQNSHSLRQK